VRRGHQADHVTARTAAHEAALEAALEAAHEASWAWRVLTGGQRIAVVLESLL
jgi:acyl-CoA reductase-like NAD-dependent aldehyde dehydrogenase